MVKIIINEVIIRKYKLGDRGKKQINIKFPSRT